MRMLLARRVLPIFLACSIIFPKAKAASVTLGWDPSPDAATPGEVAGYKVYFGTQDFTVANSSVSVVAVQAGIATSVTITNIGSAQTYFFAVVAVDPTGAESAFSNLISYNIPPDSGSTTINSPPPPLPSAPPSVSLAWDSSPDEAAGLVTAYKVYYSDQDFSVPSATNANTVVINTGLQTSAVITNIVGGVTYFFAVVAVGPSGVESELSTVLAYTVPTSPIPQLPDGDSGSGSTTTGSSTTGTTTGGQVSTSTEVSLLGMVPRLWLYPTNGIAMLAIQGTVGATFTIQSSTNPGSASSWMTITNIKLLNPAPNVKPVGDSTLERAFVPALEAFPDPNPIDGIFRYYRIFMPLGFPILADQVLAQQGYNPRLIAVRCPGLSGYVVCYVTEEAAYLDYNSKTYIVKLVQSGPAIRQVAITVAAALGQNWTSASEFTVAADGTKFLFATVVQTDDPSTDPPLGTPRASGSDIVIDF